MDAAVVETHISTVFFVGDRVYKLRKPVDLGFIDLTTREARLRDCQREVDLNRRFAPDVYLGVVDVVDSDGRPCDHLTVLRRLPDERRLSTLVTTGADGPGSGDRDADLVAAVARRVAAVHADAPTGGPVDEAAGCSAQLARWRHGFGEVRPYLGTVLDAGVEAEIEERVERYLAGRRPLFDERVAAGRARDGHGDLLADDIFCLDDGPRILDCLEFDATLRHGDVLADVAFLAMDLERLGRGDLADGFLRHYQELSGDQWPDSLAHHHIAYRAHVRTKVACLRAGPQAQDQARQLHELCRDHLRAGEVRLVLVGGLPGTGKSTLAGALTGRRGWALLRSDEIRAELHGDTPDRYAPARLEEVYAEMVRRAGSLLGRGESVVLDATWARAVWREAAAGLGRSAHADVVALCCTAPAGVAADRIRARAAAGHDPSEATEAVARRMADGFEPWPEATEVATGPGRDPVAVAEVLLDRV